MSRCAAEDISAIIRNWPETTWRTKWQREARLRLEAEATARRLRWAVGLLVIGLLAVFAMIGIL